MDITLTCRLKGKSKTYPIEINTSSTAELLKDRIKEKFACNGARDLELWKVDICNDNEDEVLHPSLQIKLEGTISDFWKGQPSENRIHVIIDSFSLEQELTIRELREQLAQLKIENPDENESEFIFPKGRRSKEEKLQDLCSAKIISPDVVLQIRKRYKKKFVDIKCRVTNIDNGKLSVTIIAHTGSDWDAHLEILANGEDFVDPGGDSSPFDYYDDEQAEDIFGRRIEKSISTVEELEELLLDECELPKENRNLTDRNCESHILVIRYKKFPKSIERLKTDYIERHSYRE